jgi:hypothetical protein
MFGSIFHRATIGAALTVLCVASSAIAEDKNATTDTAPGVEVLYTGYTKNADHSTSVFVRMTGEVPVAQARAAQQLTYHLTGARLKAHNNLNPLLTEHFGPPVSRISLISGKDGVDLVIDLSAPTNGVDPASHRVVARDGQATLLVTFPPPNAS